MKKFLRTHQEIVLGAIGLFFTAVLALYFVWGIKTIAISLNAALTPDTEMGGNVRFDLEGAREALRVGKE